MLAVSTFVSNFTSFPSFCTVKSNLFAHSVVKVFITLLFDFSMCSDWYTGIPWYNNTDIFCASVRFLCLGIKLFMIVYVHEVEHVGRTFEGTAVGASASAKLNALLISRMEIL
ncbi:hypothetical protein AAHE18_10G059700 [Arachis hypogaea]